MRLVAEGKVELNAPVRRYIPELQLKDTQAAEKVTVLNLLNHTSGWTGESTPIPVKGRRAGTLCSEDG